MSKSTSLSEEDVCQRIRDSILEQRLTPGTKLTEESLCGIFGVSRTTIRRVFLLLSKDNIITLEKNKGAVIASPSVEQAHQVFEARATIEHALLKLASESAKPADIATLRVHLEREQDALNNANLAAWIRLSGEFHIVLARIARNEPMCSFLEQLVFQSSLIIALYGTGGAPSNCKGGEHERLVDALEQKDSETAQRIMAEHLASIEKQLSFETETPNQDLQAIFAGSAA